MKCPNCGEPIERVSLDLSRSIDLEPGPETMVARPVPGKGVWELVQHTRTLHRCPPSPEEDLEDDAQHDPDIDW